MNILIVDYKVGNNQSVTNALNVLGYNFLVSDKKEDIKHADVFIMPGVGAFGEAMKNIRELGFLETLSHEVLVNKKPILGICLGMQILAEQGEENGVHQGLSWIPGKVTKIEGGDAVRVPHVGWNSISIVQKSPLFETTEENADFYFDHSYQFVTDHQYVSATCQYGGTVVAGVQKGNIFGVQFHPEKSQVNGLKLFRSFFNHVKK